MITANNFNVCVVQPNGYLHSAAFFELAELIGYSLNDLGKKTTIHINKIVPNTTNIILGCHLYDTNVIAQLPPSTIIVNTEQISNSASSWSQQIFEWATHFEMWDYSERNIQALQQQQALNVKRLRIGYHNKLARIDKAENQDIDILFYGSVNERRAHILNALKQSGHAVRVEFGLYGQARDQLIARSKVVLNLHYYDSQIFEIVRTFYLMSNAKAIVTEINQDTAIDPCYLTGVQPANYEQLVEQCIELVKNETLRHDLETRALNTIMALPQAPFTFDVLKHPIQ